jgi:hypothetical protein
LRFRPLYISHLKFLRYPSSLLCAIDVAERLTGNLESTRIMSPPLQSLVKYENPSSITSAKEKGKGPRDKPAKKV